MSMTVRWTGVLVAGWLAQQLAGTDRDVERGIEAYEARDFDAALAAFDAAIARRGERPELSLDRGLVLLAKDDRDGARTAFERASESDDMSVRASGFYELGNLALDAEEWDAAIEHYIHALEARPDHANAKWNLELALQRKRAEEQKQEEEQKQDEQEQQDGEEGEDGEKQDGEEGDEKQDDEQKDDGEKQDGEEGDEKQDEQKDDEKQDGEEGEQEQPPQPEGEDEKKDQPQPSEEQAAPQALSEMDVKQALEQLDEQDAFVLDKPAGGYVQPEKDW